MKLKNIIFIGFIATAIYTTSISANFGISTTSKETILKDTFNSYLLLDGNTFAESVNILKIAKSLENAENLDNDYLKLVLRLSDDIGVMADRIGVMADRILLMSDEIGVMADRILITQRIQNSNIEMTQNNISETRDILISLLNR